jgi:Family of unknown function (DUF6282)
LAAVSETNGSAPTTWARDIVRGAYDTHVHIAPDVMQRRITDLELARRFNEVGLAGFVLKSHYVPTAERASVVNAAVPGIDAVGAISLNASLGGLNPMAVEIAARLGARVVWMPTVDAANHRRTAHDLPPGATPPMWLALQRELAEKGLEPAAVEVLDEEARPLAALRAVCELVAEHGLVLATGHLGRDEIFAVCDVALAAGVGRVVVTHPEFPQQNLSLPDQQALAARGCYLERCWTTPFTGKYDWAQMVANIRATGAGRTLISSDLGQPDNPPVEDGLALMADALRQAGFGEADITTMIVTNSRVIGGPPE